MDNKKTSKKTGLSQEVRGLDADEAKVVPFQATPEAVENVLDVKLLLPP